MIATKDAEAGKSSPHGLVNPAIDRLLGSGLPSS